MNTNNNYSYKLATIIEGISSWSDLETRIAGLPTEMDRGNAFEEFCHAFFILDPVFQFKEVYRQKEIPPSILARLGYPGIKDIGIDGVALSNDGKLTAYQAKFRSDRNNTPTLSELSTFFTMSDRADWRITITNTNKLPSSIHDRTRQSCVLSDRFCQLNADFFNRLRIWLSQRTIPPPEKWPPHETQREAISAAMTHFKDNSRGHLVLPCGTGKTLCAMWIAEGLGGKRILVIVPSLALLSQTLREWAVNTSLKPFRYLCLCSDTTVDLGNDSPVEHLYEMDVPVTTNADVVSEYLKAEENTTSVLFSTYQSSEVLSEASLKANIHFDVAIFDEAHRTAGAHNSIWGLALDDKNVPVKKRLFMTATPRIYAPHITKKAAEKDILLCSMDDHAIYGEPIYKMSFGQAIERDLITPYKVVVICVTDAEVSELVNKGKTILTAENQAWDARALAKRIALVKAMKGYGFKKMFTFHSRVSGAAEFTKNDSPYSFKSVIDILDINIPEKIDIKCFHVNGEMSSGERNARMEEFKKAQTAIMSNARCLNEGVDVPLVDAIAFIDPKKSIIDIVQATGRAMRKAKGKGKGYIFVPVFVGEEADPEKYLDSSDFKTVWQVLQAMVDHDQHIQDVISRLRILQGMGEVGSKEWNAAMAEYREKVEFFNLPSKVDTSRFIEALTTKIIEVIARQWDFWFGLMIKYKNHHGNANAPNSYKTPEGFNLGSWQNNQRQYFKRGTLEQDRIKKLEEIGFVWDQLEELFNQGFEETLRYKNQHGTANAPASYKTPEGFNLGSWQSHQSGAYKKGKLEHDRIKKLEDVGFVWDQLDEFFNKGFEETLRYKNQHGNANAPNSYKTPEGFNLGSWQSERRKSFKNGTLEQDRIKKLEEIGFVWDQLEELFNQGFEETLRYKNQHGTANAPASYKTPEGFNLGSWQSRQGNNFRNGKLEQDKIKKLEEIGFVWDQLEELFNQGFEETLRYKKQHGNANAPTRHKTPEGFNLGTWQSNQRQYFKRGALEQDRIKKLEDVGFVWDQLDEFFNKGFEETLRYKNQHGNANAPNSYKTPEGFNLGTWQNNQRQYFKRGTLEQDRIKKLEDVGFVWDQLDEFFNKGFEETLRYKNQHGTANAPARDKTPDGFKLGKWQSHQRTNFRTGKLEQDKIKKLEEIDFVWDQLGESFNKGFEETLRYKKQHGNANVPVSYKTPEGFNLGSWQSERRKSFKNGQLEQDRIKKLEEIGFIWDHLEESFNQGFEETLRYKNQHGNANAPNRHKTPEGFNLGTWQSRQGNNFRNGKLEQDKIKKLEEIGFVWDQLEEFFNKGFEETLRYKNQHGNANAPNSYKTPEGFNLGSWQSHQRGAYKNGKLKQDRIKKLEDIGFVWRRVT